MFCTVVWDAYHQYFGGCSVLWGIPGIQLLWGIGYNQYCAGKTSTFHNISTVLFCFLHSIDVILAEYWKTSTESEQGDSLIFYVWLVLGVFLSVSGTSLGCSGTFPIVLGFSVIQYWQIKDIIHQVMFVFLCVIHKIFCLDMLLTNCDSFPHTY